MSNSGKPAVVITRWWWVRHAPVRSDGGNIYGQQDIACDCGDLEVFMAVAHGGTIMAAVGLALGQPEKGLAFEIGNCSVTRLDHFASPGKSIWRLPMVNQQPWIADAKHAAMHQPAGPEVIPESKLA